MKLHFYLRFYTQFGQSLWISGDIGELGDSDPSRAFPMEYLNDEYWYAAIDIKKKSLQENIGYKYCLKNKDGELIAEWGNDRVLESFLKEFSDVHLIDTWNHAGEYENAFFSAPFRKVLLKGPQQKERTDDEKELTHIFKVKAPLLKKNESLCLSGNCEALGNWEKNEVLINE